MFVVFFSASQTVFALVKYPYPDKKTIFISNENDSTYLKGEVRIINPDGVAWLVQAWAESQEKVKYSIVYPLLTRVEGNNSTNLKIYINDSDKSKMKWFAVKIMPSIDYELDNKLTIPIIYRLKIDYKADK